MKLRGPWLGLGLGLGIIIIVAAGGFILNRVVPSVDAQLNALEPDIIVMITQPVYGQSYQPGIQVSILVEAVSRDPLQKLEAFVDGASLPISASSPVGAGKSTAVFLWSTSTEGDFAITARATDISGKTALSNVVWVSVTAPPAAGASGSIIRSEPLPVEDLDFVLSDLEAGGADLSSAPPDADFTDRLDAAVESLAAMPSQPGSLLPRVNPPTGPVPLPYPNVLSAAPPSPSALEKFTLWFAQAQTIPGTPGLSAEVDGCAVRLVVQDNAEDETGLRLMHMGPGEGGFGTFANFKAFPGTGAFAHTDPNREAGKHQYIAVAYNSKGSMASDPVSVEVSEPACEPDTPQVLGLVEAVLAAKQPVDMLYCYMTVDGSDWERMPGGQDEFILPENGKFDLSPYMQALAEADASAKTITTDCWGWKGATLIPLGRASHALNPGAVNLSAPGYDLTGVVQPGHAKKANDSFKAETFAPPGNLHYPSSIADCEVYGGSDTNLKWACNLYINEDFFGNAVVVWHWNEHDNCSEAENYCGYNVPLSEVKGFRLYRMDPGQAPVLLQETGSNQVWMAIINPSQAGGTTQDTAYFVRAFKQDGTESADSNYLFFKPVIEKTSISAGVYSTTTVRVHKRIGILPEKTLWVSSSYPIFSAGEPPCSSLDCPDSDVGFTNTSKHIFDGTFKYVNVVMDAFFVFDLSNISGNLESAELLWTHTLSMQGNGWDYWAEGCQNTIGDSFGGTLLPAPLMIIDGTDVTALVSQYLAGTRSYSEGIELPFGFFFNSGNRIFADVEANNGHDVCMMKITDVWLEVRMYK